MSLPRAVLITRQGILVLIASTSNEGSGESHQSLRSSHIPSMDGVDEDSDQKSRCGEGVVIGMCTYAISTNISCASPYGTNAMVTNHADKTENIVLIFFQVVMYPDKAQHHPRAKVTFS